MKKIVTLFSIVFLALLDSACGSRLSSKQSGEYNSAVGYSALQPLVEAAGET